MAKRIFVGLMLILSMLAGCASPAAPVTNTPPTPAPTLTTAPVPLNPPNSTQPPQPTPASPLVIFYDDDGSPDGTLALLYLLSHPAADVQAVSISYGEAHPAQYIQHMGRMLDSFGITSIPLGAGQDSPLEGDNGFPEGMREMANDFWGATIPYPERTYPTQPADELIISVLNAAPEPVTLLIVGPCTNLAKALRQDPGIKDHIAAVYIMGGAVNVPGNIRNILGDSGNNVAEWNIYADPVAAREVFESGLDLFLVPLDATDQVLVSHDDTSQWRQGGAAARFAADFEDLTLGRWGTAETDIWDLVTAAIMLEPELCPFTPLALQVITQPGDTSGQTLLQAGAAPNINVCLDPEVELLRQRLVEVFGSSQ
jgi:inosine-uridine nucleoside N-ribohydrolase